MAVGLSLPGMKTRRFRRWHFSRHKAATGCRAAPGVDPKQTPRAPEHCPLFPCWRPKWHRNQAPTRPLPSLSQAAHRCWLGHQLPQGPCRTKAQNRISPTNCAFGGCRPNPGRLAAQKRKLCEQWFLPWRQTTDQSVLHGLREATASGRYWQYFGRRWQ